MKSICDAAENAEYINRINALSPSSTALWGKMNVSQMLAHCQVLSQLAIGELQVKRAFLGRIFGGIAKKQIMADGPVKKNLPTLKEAEVAEECNFDEEKASLIALVKRMQTLGHQGMQNFQHPFFGDMTAQEWDHLTAKHLDHHLSQFGV